MKIIILAAGRGERLMPLTRNTPKPLLDMGNGCTLIEEQIQSIQESGAIQQVVLVTGYLADQVDAKLHHMDRNGLTISTVYNPFYDVSNNLMSLWLARHEMDADFLITNGDNLFTPDVFRCFTADNGDGIFLAINPKTTFDQDDMKVILDGGHVACVSKKLDPERASAESPGLALVRGARARKLFLGILEELGRSPENVGKFWLETFNRAYERGVPVTPWEFDGANKWQEVDIHVDVVRVKELIALKADSIRKHLT